MTTYTITYTKDDETFVEEAHTKQDALDRVHALLVETDYSGSLIVEDNHGNQVNELDRSLGKWLVNLGDFDSYPFDIGDQR